MRLFHFRKKKEEKVMYLIAGLGNPEAKYEKTRHNIGFDALDVLAARHHITINHMQQKAVTGTGYIEGQKVLLVKPLTYMNLSGTSIGPLLRYYKLDADSQLIVLYDDISLDPGNIRVRTSGSAGGHNGIKDIIANTGTEGFSRVRVGVGAKPKDWDLADYVLGRFSGEDRKIVDRALEDAADAVELMLQDRVEEAMNRYNRKKKKEKPAKVKQAKTELPAAEQAKAKAQKAETLAAEQTRAEAPKAEAPAAEQAKAEA